ncbi:MAG: hypothetical protein HYS41_04800 [Candidatus Omnitrophica bacterium]|nr:hypothetical protein [Candidatus Omnitrophota bacterium]
MRTAERRCQKIFRRAAIARLRSELRDGRALKGYFEETFRIKPKEVMLSTIELRGKMPKLKAPKRDPVSADLENAIALHSYYSGLDETQASDPRLWAYLSHVEFRKYALVRWGLSGSFKVLQGEAEKIKAINQIIDHWFVSGNDRDLRRHAIARLWWAAHLTFAPWERDPEFFAGLKRKDPYHYTRVLLATQDIYQQVLERAMGRSNRILISILDYLDQNPDFAASRERIRGFTKELNLLYGTKKLIGLDRGSLSLLIESVASDAAGDGAVTTQGGSEDGRRASSAGRNEGAAVPAAGD